MPLVFATFLPHTPILHEPIGKEKNADLKKTNKAYKLIKDELYVTRPDTIIIITPHGRQHPHSFEIMGHPTINIDLSAFGDLITEEQFETDTKLVSHIKEAADKQGIPLRTDSRSACDYGSAIPLLNAVNELFFTKIVIIRTAQLNNKAHLDFGYLIKDTVMHESKRIAILVTGDLAHSLTNKSPAGFKKGAEEFDTTVTEILESGHLSRLVNLDPKLVYAAATCAHEPLLMLAGLLARVKTHPRLLAYEAPHGVGYVSVHFPLH